MMQLQSESDTARRWKQNSVNFSCVNWTEHTKYRLSWQLIIFPSLLATPLRYFSSFKWMSDVLFHWFSCPTFHCFCDGFRLINDVTSKTGSIESPKITQNHPKSLKITQNHSKSHWFWGLHHKEWWVGHGEGIRGQPAPPPPSPSVDSGGSRSWNEWQSGP